MEWHFSMTYLLAAQGKLSLLVVAFYILNYNFKLCLFFFPFLWNNNINFTVIPVLVLVVQDAR